MPRKNVPDLKIENIKNKDQKKDAINGMCIVEVGRILYRNVEIVARKSVTGGTAFA